MPGTPETRAEALSALRERALGCTRCPQLVATRTQVVFGSGPPDADLMFVGEAPGATEDRDGVPFVGASGRLLDRLLAEIGLQRADVAVVNVLKCRPPENRNPLAGEIENCQEYLFGQLELMQPIVVCTLGNFATKLLRASNEGITKVHGRDEVRVIGPRAVRLLPLFHPAAALYTPSNVELLRADVARIPGLLALGAPDQPAPVAPEEVEVEVEAEAGPLAGVAGTSASAAAAPAATRPSRPPARRRRAPEPAAEPGRAEPPPPPPPPPPPAADDAQLGLF